MHAGKTDTPIGTDEAEKLAAQISYRGLLVSYPTTHILMVIILELHDLSARTRILIQECQIVRIVCLHWIM